MRCKEYYTSKIGETNYNFYGSKMTIIEFVDCKNVTIKFDNGYIMKTRYSEFKSGDIKNPYDKRVFGVGYHGIGTYKVSIKQKHTIQYHYWYDMLKRCYDKRYTDKHTTYKKITVCEEWHNFQVFSKWFDDNYYTVEGQRMELDKDIINPTSTQYNPDNCSFVPKIINTLFVKPNSENKSRDLPLGVEKYSEYKYVARVSKRIDGTRDTYKGFLNYVDAFKKYKEVKEDYIKEMADRYKDYIPEPLYKALYRYEVVDIYGIVTI